MNVTEPGSLLKALRALQRLHAAGYCHGSAREDNLLACGAVFKWCDLQRAQRHGDEQVSVEIDVKSLLISFNHEPLSAYARYMREFSMEGLRSFVVSLGVDPVYLGEEDGSNATDVYTKKVGLTGLIAKFLGLLLAWAKSSAG